MNPERKKHILIGAGTFLLIWLTFSLLRQPASMGGMHLTMTFDRADGLSNTAEVRLSGMKIGTVISKSINSDYQAVIEIEIDSQIPVPDDSIAFIQTDGLFGGKYIQIGLGGSEDFLQDGDSIEYTQGAADIEGLAREVIRRVSEKK